MLGLLPWERWLHPSIYGPLLTAVSIWVMYAKTSLAWWGWLLLGGPRSSALGALSIGR